MQFPWALPNGRFWNILKMIAPQGGPLPHEETMGSPKKQLQDAENGDKPWDLSMAYPIIRDTCI